MISNKGTEQIFEKTLLDEKILCHNVFAIFLSYMQLRTYKQ